MTVHAFGQTQTLDRRAFRDALGHFASGVTVISGVDDDGLIGFTCQSFYSVSMDPPLVSICVMKDSSTYPRIRDTGKFTVNVLAHHQDAISNQFARKGTDKWSGVSWTPTPGGSPAIDDSVLWLDCTIWNEHEAGDHFIVIGHVNAMSQPERHQHEPLLFFQGSYRSLSTPLTM